MSDPHTTLEKTTRDYVEHLKAEGVDADTAYTRVLDRLLANYHWPTRGHVEFFAAHLVYDTVYAEVHKCIEVWVGPEGSAGMFAVDGKSEEQLAFLREGTCKAVFHDMTWPAAKKLYEIMLGHATEDERWRKKYEAAFARIDALVAQLEKTWSGSRREILKSQARILSRLSAAVRTEKQPEWDRKFGCDYHQMRDALLAARSLVVVVRDEAALVKGIDDDEAIKVVEQIDAALQIQEVADGD